jgi:hypothetical protein
MTITLDDEKDEKLVYLLDDVVNTLANCKLQTANCKLQTANCKLLHRRTSNNVGSTVTSVLIKQVKRAITDLGYDPTTLQPMS